MAPRPLVLYPDPRLREQAKPVTAWDDELQALARDVLDTLSAVAAVGLTASHLGDLRRLVVIRLEPGAEPRTYVNPELVWTSPARAVHTEGSVSMPGVTEAVERSAVVKVRYQDLSGAVYEEEAQGFRAACLQHEIDQLNGMFWLERLSRLKRERAIKRLAKLRRAEMV